VFLSSLRIRTIVLVSTLLAGIFLSYVAIPEQESSIISQPIFAQVELPSYTILLNKTNMTTQFAPSISENTSIILAPEVNDTLIGTSTPTTSNITLPTNEVNNKSGEAEPVGGIK
jgi:hypothetical protein